MSTALSFNRMQELCRHRLAELTKKFGESHGANWSDNDWFTALTGEVGELGNLLKKVRRGDLFLKDADTRDKIAMEYADIMAYLIYLGNALQIDVDEAVVKKWNIIGERLNLNWNIDLQGNLVERKKQ